MTSKKNKWTEDEILFLKENYQNKGLTFMCDKLNKHTKNSIAKKAKEFNLKVDKSIYYYDENKLREIIKESYSYKEVLNKMNKSSSGMAYTSLIRYIKKKNITTTHFDSFKNNGGNQIKIPIEEWLKLGTNIASSKLKEKLYKEMLKKRICELCGQNEWWKGKKISLILDHKNGINNDNKLENLQIVCPNCNATLPTFCRGNKKINGGFNQH